MGSFGKCALIIAHPGHEIRVHGWLEKTKPVVYVLTDGSGRSGHSRLASTKRLLDRAGARPGQIYGRLSDRDLYQTVLRGDLAYFHRLTAELADEIVRERFDFVLGDAPEGEILTHDLWRGVIDAAVKNAQERLARPIANFQFPLEGPPEGHASVLTTRTLRLVLDDAALTRKIAAARSYPELKREVEDALTAYGEDVFRVECFQCANRWVAATPIQIPRYERHGERLVAAGVYTKAVRYTEHMVPILSELERWRRVG
jgi:hypothetical protein